MSNVKSFTIGGVQYNAAMASAVDQDKLLSLLTGAVIERAMVSAKAGIELGNDVLVPMFMSMPQSIKLPVTDILMGRVLINGTDRNVTVADFGGKMVNYNELLANLFRWNLSDFFDWLPHVLSDARAAEKNPAQ